jgi:predicted small metal-binding protein
MEPDTLRVRCACGWEVVGTEEEVVPATQEHGRRVHNMAATRDQVLAMATSGPRAGAMDPADPADAL